MEKQKLQQQELQKLKGESRIFLKWATGCGKSKMTIDLINEDTKPFKRVLFVVAERAHIKNWEDEFSKWHLKRDNVATYMCCYASLKKYIHMAFDIVVFDEAHHLFSPTRWAALEEMKENGNLSSVYLLSATLSKDKQDRIEEKLGRFTISTVTLKEAINEDILPDPKVYVVELELDNTKPNQEVEIGKPNKNSPVVRWEHRNKYIYGKKSCIVKCTEFQKYSYYTSTMEYWKNRYSQSKNPYHQNMWVNMGSIRKRYLGELKTANVFRLLNSLNKRFVCFCASVKQADILSHTNTISSKRTGNKNQQIIDAFNNKKINSIYAVGMITEGMNLTDIQVGVIIQLDGKERLFVQKFGRSLRAEDPVTYIFYYKGTQDEVYLKKALENIDRKYVKFIKPNEL
jgi:superfamily II DNA or RNA helicase